MRNILPLLLLFFVFLSCDEDTVSQQEQLAIDIGIIEQYLADNNLTAQKTASGLHYIIHNQGIGLNPNINANVIVVYKGYFTNGFVFDEVEIANPTSFPLSAVIQGWQEGIQLMRKEGRATLFIPSYLGYGTASNGQIPPNSVLIFDVELLDF